MRTKEYCTQTIDENLRKTNTPACCHFSWASARSRNFSCASRVGNQCLAIFGGHYHFARLWWQCIWWSQAKHRYIWFMSWLKALIHHAYLRTKPGMIPAHGPQKQRWLSLWCGPEAIWNRWPFRGHLISVQPVVSPLVKTCTCEQRWAKGNEGPVDACTCWQHFLIQAHTPRGSPSRSGSDLAPHAFRQMKQQSWRSCPGWVGMRYLPVWSVINRIELLIDGTKPVK